MDSLLNKRQMEKILTIIIPTYNMEQYLPHCLDSLLIGKGLENVEALVVNDGSKDRSSAIAHQYESKYPQTFRVIDKQNGNYGSCINRGLKEATGKYVKVLDADDSFDTKHFEEFVAYLSHTDADLVLSDFAVMDIHGQIRKIIRYDFNHSELLSVDDICTKPEFVNGIQMHAVTYKLENLLKFHYKQTEGISYTDQQWIFSPMMMVHHVTYYNHYVYKYLIGRGEQTMNPLVKAKYISHTAKCALGMLETYESHKNEIVGKSIQEYINARLFSYIKSVYVFYLMHYNVNHARLLQEYDKQIGRISTDVYQLLGNKEITSIMGFSYIDYLRNHPSVSPIVIKFFSQVYRALLQLKSFFCGKEDRMAIPKC